MWFVCRPSSEVAAAWVGVALSQPVYGGNGSPAPTGELSALSVIRQDLVAAYAGSSKPCCGTSTYSLSPMYAFRSAKARRDASRYWKVASARDSLLVSNEERMFSASPIVMPAEDGGAMPYTSRPR